MAVCVAAGCAGQELGPGDAPTLSDKEGLVAIVVDAPTAVERITFSPDAGGAGLVSLQRLAPADDLRLLRLPAGRYCLDTIEYDVVGMGSKHDVCFEVVAQLLRYPGHLVIERVEGGHLGHQARFRWEPRAEDFAALLRTRWPTLADSPPQAPQDEPFEPPEPETRPFDE